MDIIHELNGLRFIWNADKAASNLNKHGLSFEQAATAFFDPFFQLTDASRHDEARDAIIGYDVFGRLLFVVHYDVLGRLLFVVHIEYDGDAIRLISARRATTEERNRYDS